MYYIFYKSDNSGINAVGANFFQDISSLSLQQGDEITLEWELGVPNLADNQLPINDTNGNPITWTAATYPDTKIKVFVYGDDDGSGTAHGTQITHGQMLASIGGQQNDFFDEIFSFSRCFFCTLNCFFIFSYFSFK